MVGTTQRARSPLQTDSPTPPQKTLLDLEMLESGWDEAAKALYHSTLQHLADAVMDPAGIFTYTINPVSPVRVAISEQVPAS